MRERRSRQFWWYTAAFVAYFLQLAGGMAVSVLFTLSGPRTDGLEIAVVVAERFSYFAIGATALTYTFIEGREMWLANRLKEHFRQEGFEAGYAKAVEDMKRRENGANDKPADREPPERSE